MAHKYVAFGQLIDGELTLKKIESVPTFYESPDYCIYIHDAGILNLECHDIRINKNTNEYIDGHIEDLNLLGEMLYEVISITSIPTLLLNLCIYDIQTFIYIEFNGKTFLGTGTETHSKRRNGRRR